MRKLVAVMFTLAVIGLASAQENGSPYFLLTEEGDVEAFPLRHTDVDVKIGGVIADVTVSQHYANDGNVPIEAVYVFPASSRAAVHGMTVTIGDRVLQAEIREREEARAEYEEAREEGRNAALLEQERPNVFMMSVANIMPGDQVEVTLQYSELLVPDRGVYEFVYPTVVGPRYGSEDFNENPYLEEGEPAPYGFGIRIELVTGVELADLQAPGHDVVVRDTGQAALITLADGESGGNRDFILQYRLGSDSVSGGLLLQPDPDGQGGWFLAMAQPPARETVIDLPTDYLFVVDVSGSMHGYPLATAQSLLDSILAELTPGDHFNILLFSGGSSVMAPESLPFTAANVEKARQFLAWLDGAGGTELLAALRKALALPATDNMSRSIILVTDGFVTVEREALQLVRERLGEANLFAFGIGSSVNRHLIEALARAGQGEPFVVTSADEAPAVAERLRSYVAAPVLTDVTVTFDGLQVSELEPAVQPDLLAERPVLVFGRFEGPATGSVSLSGLGTDGSWEHVVDVASEGVTVSGEPLSRLWARSVIARLSDDLSVSHVNIYGDPANPGTSDGQARITELGLQFSLLTEFTSFVAVDTEIRADGTAVQVRQPLPLPAGVSGLAVGDTMAAMITQTAVPLPSFAPEVEAERDRFETGEIVIEDVRVALDLTEAEAHTTLSAVAEELAACLPVGTRLQATLFVTAEGQVRQEPSLRSLGAPLSGFSRDCLWEVLEGLGFSALGEVSVQLYAQQAD